MTAPLVSVCIGSYNREKYIRETLDSVFAQTYPHLEVIVVDDASTDRTVDIIRSYGERVRLIVRERNSGMCPVTRNQAVRAATGEFVALLDSDDAWLPAKIERQIAFMAAHPEIPLCHTACELMDEHSRRTGIRHEGALPPTGNCFRALLRHCWITISSVLLRRSLFETVGWFNEDPAYGIWGEDLEFFLRVARCYPIGLVGDGEPLARYRRAAGNISSGNWKCTPESVPLHRMIVDREDIWKGLVPRVDVVDAFVSAALENGQYWRDRGFPERAWWFAAEAAKLAPVERRVLAALAKAGVKRLLKPAGYPS